jgi:hypothetical protein
MEYVLHVAKRLDGYLLVLSLTLTILQSRDKCFVLHQSLRLRDLNRPRNATVWRAQTWRLRPPVLLKLPIPQPRCAI